MATASDNTLGITAKVCGISEYYALANLVDPAGPKSSTLNLSFTRYLADGPSDVLPFKTALTTATVNKGLLTASWNGQQFGKDELMERVTYLRGLIKDLYKDRGEINDIKEMIFAVDLVDEFDLANIFSLAYRTQQLIKKVAVACTFNSSKATNSDMPYLIPAYSPYGWKTDTFRAFDLSLRMSFKVLCPDEESIQTLTHPDIPGVSYTTIPERPPQEAIDVANEYTSEAKTKKFGALVESTFSCNYILICLAESELNYIKYLASMEQSDEEKKRKYFKQLKSVFQTNYTKLNKSIKTFAGRRRQQILQEEDDEAKLVIQNYLPADPGSKEMLPVFLTPVNDSDFTLSE